MTEIIEPARKRSKAPRTTNSAIPLGIASVAPAGVQPTRRAMQDNGKAMIHVPQTAAELLPPKPSSLIADAASFLRVHYDELLPYFKALSGEGPSIHGAWDLDEAGYTFKAHAMIKAGGNYPALAALNDKALRKALRQGWKRNTDISMATLAVQCKQLRIEQVGSPTTHDA